MVKNKIYGLFEGRLRYLATVVSILTVAWLTLVPDPLPDQQTMVWPGFDKMGHLLLMGFVTTMWLCDYFRGRKYRVMPAAVCVAVVVVFAWVIEILQGAMALGRSEEYADIVAGAIGSVCAAVAWSLGRTGA